MDIGCTITYSGYFIGNTADLKLMCSDGNSYIKTITTRIDSLNFQEYVLSTDIPENTVNVRLRIQSLGETIIYADNFSMYIQ